MPTTSNSSRPSRRSSTFLRPCRSTRILSMWRRSKSSSSFSRVVTQIIMLFAIGVASPSRSIHVCVMAFRNIVRSDMKRQHQLLSSARIAPTKKSVVTRYDNTFLPDYSIRSGASRIMSTKYSIHEEDGDYNSMTVSDLRELLRQRGLAISGIKAQLVERLESGEINPGKIGSRQKLPRNNEMKKSNRMRSVEDRANIDQGDKNETRDDLAGLVNHLKSLEAGNDAKTDPKRATIQDLNRRTGPKNLVFAKGGEEDSDDEWGDDEDYEEEDDDSDNDDNDIDDYDIDPNTTSRAPPINRSKSVGDTTSFKEDFQGTRVFVQGLPEEATWKDLKDHFNRSIAGEVVFASVSIDKNTGKSKNCGIVQFETPSMAKEAIREMRNYPMNGATLYVREDVQESKQREGSRVGRGKNNDDRYEIDTRAQTKSKSSIPTEWKRANDNDIDGEGDMWYDLKDDELKEIESIIQKRDGQRRQNNYKMSDKLREKLKDDFGVHLDDRLKLWWTDTKHGGVPRSVSDIKGEGRWGNLKPWRQIPTNPKSDAMVDSDHVMQLLSKRDRARKKKDFKTADDLLQNAYSAPKGGLTLRIHDESRTWRIWTEAPPQKKGETPAGYEKLTPVDMCLQIVEENEPDKVDEMRELLKKFPGREWSIFKRLKGRYDISE